MVRVRCHTESELLAAAQFGSGTCSTLWKDAASACWNRGSVDRPQPGRRRGFHFTATLSA